MLRGLPGSPDDGRGPTPSHFDTEPDISVILTEPQPQPDHDVAGKAAAAAEGAEAAATKIQAGSRGMMSRNK